MNTIEQLNNLISKVAEIKNWKNYEVHTNTEKTETNGFMGDFFTGSVTNKDTQESLSLAIKKSFENKEKRELYFSKQVFGNEIYFYSHIVPTLEKFLKEKQITQPMNYLAKCYLTTDEEFCESIVMENVKDLGYDILGRQAFLEDKHVRYAFETYGKFHGIFFAYKDQYAEEYRKIVGKFFDFFKVLATAEVYQNLIKSNITEASNFINEELNNHFQGFFDNISEEFTNLCTYKGKYSCILHGDCWSNNIMFKEAERVEGIKLIDFQIIKEGSPVQDLSYLFYAGCTDELYKNLDEYLKIYYNSFSKTVTELGSDPNELFPFDALIEDWKKYSRFGLLRGLEVVKVKLFSSEDIEKLAKSDMEGYFDVKVNTNVFEKFVKNLFQHFYDREIL